jgi:hypothetical protein
VHAPPRTNKRASCPDSADSRIFASNFQYGIGSPLRERGLEPFASPEILSAAACAITVTLLDIERDAQPVARWALARKTILRCHDAHGRAAWVPALDVVVSRKHRAGGARRARDAPAERALPLRPKFPEAARSAPPSDRNHSIQVGRIHGNMGRSFRGS